MQEYKDARYQQNAVEICVQKKFFYLFRQQEI